MMQRKKKNETDARTNNFKLSAFPGMPTPSPTQHGIPPEYGSGWRDEKQHRGYYG